MLPKDDIILLSVINTRLRDKYASLKELCEDCGEDEENIKKRLFDVGYEYNEEKNQFV